MMRLIRKPILAAVLLFAALCGGQQITAQTTVAGPVYSLVVYTTDGGRAAFAFDDRPEMTIAGSTFRVSSTMADVEYPATDIHRFTIEDGDGRQAYENFWLVVHTTDGIADGYAFTDYPKVFIRGEMFYVTANGKTLGYRAVNIERFTIEDHYTGDPTPHGGVVTAIDGLRIPVAGSGVGGDSQSPVPARSADSQPQLRLSPGNVSLSGLVPGSTVRVYDGSGRLAQSATAGNDGTLRFSFETLLPGVYVVRTDNTSFKIVRK